MGVFEVRTCGEIFDLELYHNIQIWFIAVKTHGYLCVNMSLEKTFSLRGNTFSQLLSFSQTQTSHSEEKLAFITFSTILKTVEQRLIASQLSDTVKQVGENKVLTKKRTKTSSKKTSVKSMEEQINRDFKKSINRDLKNFWFL